MEKIKQTHEPKNLRGVVKDCTRLNIRKQPTLNSEIITTIVSGTYVNIETSNPDEDWVLVNVKDLKGYCMSKYIELQQVY